MGLEHAAVELAALNGYEKQLPNLKSTQQRNTMQCNTGIGRIVVLLMARTSRLLGSLQSYNLKCNVST